MSYVQCMESFVCLSKLEAFSASMGLIFLGILIAIVLQIKIDRESKE